MKTAQTTAEAVARGSADLKLSINRDRCPWRAATMARSQSGTSKTTMAVAFDPMNADR